VALAARSAARCAEDPAATNRLTLLALLNSTVETRSRSPLREQQPWPWKPRLSVSSLGLPPLPAQRLRSACSAAAGKPLAAKPGQRGAAAPAPAHQGRFSSGTLHTFLSPPELMPNPSFKPSPNSVARQPSSAGPAAQFALAVRRTTLSVPA